MSLSEDFSNLSGLSEQEAKERLLAEGKNELPPPPDRRFFRTLLGVISEPMLLLLMICGTIYLVIGNRTEAIVLFSFVLFVLFNTLYQERKTEHALAALKELSSPRATVIRGGVKQHIDSRLVVNNDLICLSEGDRIPADAVLVTCTNLLTDESLLTGESLPVRKIHSENWVPLGEPGGEDGPFVYSGTLVIRGEGRARVAAIGTKTKVGHIGKALSSVKIEKTALQKGSHRVVQIFAGIGISLCVVVFFFYGILQHTWLKGLLASLALAMSVLPEEIPMIFSIFLALGAWRMSQKHVLTRRLHAIEALGAATVLCVDKTGTLTLNKMSVAKIVLESEEYSPREFHQESFREKGYQLIHNAILASQRDPFDPMETAIHELGAQLSISSKELIAWELVREYPLTPQLFSMTHVLRIPDSSTATVAAKGSPEAIGKLCSLSPTQQQNLYRHTEKLAEEGLRVIAVATSSCEQKDLPESQEGFHLSFLGLIGFADPVRPQAEETVKICRDAGIRVVMITGDHPRTAQSIGKQIGLPIEEEILTGIEIDALDQPALQEKIKRVSICARVSPQHKLRLVNALKEAGEIVAMTGDGVNDAPALKAAHIGIAMGGRGTDVAREAAALILLDDNISSWAEAIHLGRRIYDNIRKAMAYTVAIHVPIAGLALIPILFRWPLILLPIHIASLEMVIDPACSLVFEADRAEPDIMKRPPRSPKSPLFHRGMLFFSLLQGVGVLVCSLLGLGFATWQKQPEPVARTIGFFILILGNLGLILTNRSWQSGILNTLRKPNIAFWVIWGAVFILGALVLALAPLRKLYEFGDLSWSQIGLCFLGGGCSLVWSILMKWIFRSRLGKDT